MKKIILGVVCVVVLIGGIFLLTLGHGTSEQEEGSKETTGEKKEVNISLNYMGANVTPGKYFNEKSVEKEAKKSVLPSCAFAGNDTVFTYDNMEMMTNQQNDKLLIYSIFFIDDTVETNEGVKIGDSKNKMIEVYGTDYVDDISLCTYTDKGGKIILNFQIENDTITGIEYRLKI